MNFSRFGLCAATVAVLVSGMAGGQTPNPNGDIVKMIQAGLPESTVVNKIREGAGRWDTSVDGLILLKKAGATAAELDALTAVVAKAVSLAPAAPSPASIPAFGGLLGYTAAGVPYIQFPARTLVPTLTGAPSNRIYLMRDSGKPVIVIPSSSEGQDNIVPTGLHFAPKLVWTSSHEGNLLWSATDVRFEDLCLVPNLGGNIRNKKEKTTTWVDPVPLLDDFFSQKKQVVEVRTPLGFRERESLYYLGTLKAPPHQDKLPDEIFIVGLQGYTWTGRGSDWPAPAENRSIELQEFVEKLIQHPEEMIAEFAKAAKLPEDASSWPSSLDYIYNTVDTARQYASVNASFVAQLKAKQPPSSNGFGSFLNVMQGVQNMASAQSAANVAAANHDMAGQMQAAMNAGRAEAQTLNAISNPNAPAVQPLAPPDPNAIQSATNQPLANIQAKQAQVQAAQAQRSTATQVAKNSAPTPVTARAASPSATSAGSGTAPPPTCVDLGPGNCVPIAQYQQMMGQKNQQAPQMQVCPASGFVPGPGHYAACDAYIGERYSCTPGQSVPIQKPAPPPASCGGTQSIGSGGGTPVAGSKEPTENACLQMSRDAQGMPVFHNVCSFAVKYYYTPVNPRKGEYKEQNGILAPGETQTGYEGNGEQVLYYACKEGDLVVGPDGAVITQAVNSFGCVKP